MRAAAATHAAEGGGKSQREPPIAQGKKGAVATENRAKALLALSIAKKKEEKNKWTSIWRKKK